jgi:glycosyltransferase involved in cell wall biosynthesis
MNRILVLVSDTDGIGYYRFFSPHLTLEDSNFKIDIRMLTDFTLPLLEPSFLKYYKMIVFNKVIPFSDSNKEKLFFQICKQNDIKLIYDIDDYWILDPTHINYKNWKANKVQEKIETILKNVDAVITTTSIFADTIKNINPEVHVLPNAVNPEEKQWKSNKISSDKIRFLWGGGISHLVDLRLLKDEFKKFDKNFLSKAQLIMCGYDLRIKMNNNAIKKDDPYRSQWGLFESIFSNDYKYIESSEYMNYLKTSSNFDNDPNFGKNEKFINYFYQRRHTRAILDYGNMYNESDIIIAPLKANHSFNKMKSQLKIIESGIHKCPIILSNYGPYTIDDIEGKNDGIQKGWLIDESKSNWYEKMKWYIDNPTAIKEHGEALYEYVLKNYTLNVVNKKRSELYNYILTKERKDIII